MIADAASGSFPRIARLRTPEQFKATFSQGRRLSGGMFRLHVFLVDRTVDKGSSKQSIQDCVSARQPPDTALADTATARLGISVSKRVAAHAVERNRIKRIARDSFRKRRHQLPVGDYVLLAQREAAGTPSAALRAALLSLWERAIALMPVSIAPTMPAHAPSASDPN